jgi:exodeoxyribonuclease III
MKLLSWNVNGLKSVLSRNINGDKIKGKGVAKMINDNTLMTLLRKEDPDYVCLQEIRCSAKSCDHERFISKDIYPYQYVNYSKTKKGYSGTLVACKTKPLRVTYDFETTKDPGLDDEGRVITIYYNDWCLVNVYTPNSGVNGLQRLQWRVSTWDRLFREYVNKLTVMYNVIIMGDFNVIRTDIDSYRVPIPHIAGGTKEERDSFNQLLDHGFIDTFRILRPSDKKYSWVFSGARRLGFRLDYALVNGNFYIYDSDIIEWLGSDHLPLILVCELY